MAQYTSKDIYLQNNAEREFEDFPLEVQTEYISLMNELGSFGKLEYPEGKKLRGYDLFEMRLKMNGEYRAIYTYTPKGIVILSAFKKKSQKTPLREIEKALKRKRKLF